MHVLHVSLFFLAVPQTKNRDYSYHVIIIEWLSRRAVLYSVIFITNCARMECKTSTSNTDALPQFFLTGKRNFIDVFVKSKYLKQNAVSEKLYSTFTNFAFTSWHFETGINLFENKINIFFFSFFCGPKIEIIDSVALTKFKTFEWWQLYPLWIQRSHRNHKKQRIS